MTGSSGLVGAALASSLTADGQAPRRLVRSRPAPGDALWNPEAGSIDADALQGIRAVVHLAGESIAAGRWTGARKRRILESRAQPTRLLAQTLSRLAEPPEVMVSASAIGWYGDRGDERLTEESAGGTGFLAEVCREWEAACAPATERGIRVVNVRFGIVLAAAGGALARMLPLFRFGLGGRLGSGRQWWSWVSLDDVLGAIRHALVTPSLRGPVNVVAPEAVTNAEFTQVLGRVLRRPTLAPAPAFALRLALGEMAGPLLLASAHVAPEQLLATGYRFRHPQLERALRHLLGRPPVPGHVRGRLGR